MNMSPKLSIGFKTPEVERIEVLEAEILELKAANTQLKAANAQLEQTVLELQIENKNLKSQNSQARPVVPSPEAQAWH